ncbi:bifunctional UDP-2,4-diacetamido-2,4,6-trideoxy-beta-L-altropyranose hydrolase/GNAT family N-acetyltransferase [Microbacterium limosum]|uniref:Bifunctional UDP-2,4-diacetamido-2,4,6-trideoxy-beta-L-altropyranose hydrolase/GNAT family N-acetyltransferase n=1 Tax=Microbacterium limosum TaxID=3079935 RepID=A0AAU0MLL0_9MICO|nr:bifunctional UDP-2,4-diacetamido-2,4,6-trideoxy-beta-L-altropyranose hydrolase/GNAT family N-acetyltransferase [Microbacterium sp. Y20]WOQ70888.1 bifunctional UDP-2,4-diacetamido-2,4,6-trideoxy-beta-L-altropyranose hydrolase/GNAT family N-acetyltransferase [Microbacterium sp. Y20]
MQDGRYGARHADLAIDANIGGEAAFASPHLSRFQAAGGRVALTRAAVRRHRRVWEPRQARRVLVVIGGTDPFNVTPRVIDALEVTSGRLEVTVVSPAGNPNVAQAAARSRHDVTVKPFVDDLPDLAAKHDLVISAAGTSILDFACMGLPMALVSVTDNQAAGYRQATASGLGVPLGEPPHADLENRMQFLDGILADAERLRRMSEAGRQSVDGLGAWRIVSAWECQTPAARPIQRDVRPIGVRPARMSDAEQLLSWRNDPQTRLRSRQTDEITMGSHRSWLQATLESRAQLLLVAEDGQNPVGTVRWDAVGRSRWEVSINVAPTARGRGIAASALRAAERALLDEYPEAPLAMVAWVHPDNEPSLRLFSAAGYLPDKPAESGFLSFVKQRIKSDPM